MAVAVSAPVVENFALCRGSAKVGPMNTKHTAATLGWCGWIGVVAAGAMLGGCGYTDLEMAAKQREIDGLVAQIKTMKDQQGGERKVPAPAKGKGASGTKISSR